MGSMIVAIGSSRRPKVDAVREALAALAPRLELKEAFDVVAVDVPSRVHHTPLSRPEMMTGARERADALVRIAYERNEPWRYFVGLEGGLDVVCEGNLRLVFLENWAYVSDGSGAGAFGQSGAIMLPDALARRVVGAGIELSQAIDEFAGEEGVRDKQGAWGVLTRNLITRQDAVRDSVMNAFVPVLHRELYAAERLPKR
jgi:inosine/xanthosine triphosphatase